MFGSHFWLAHTLSNTFLIGLWNVFPECSLSLKVKTFQFVVLNYEKNDFADVWVDMPFLKKKDYA